MPAADWLTSYVVIPARMASTRLPNKMLLRDTGKSLIQHTYEMASRAIRPAGVIVATDHRDIVREVERCGGQAVLTSVDCPSGTDRVAEVARHLPDVDLFVNLQGDEPELDPGAIDRVIELLESDRAAVMATLATPIRDADQVRDPSCVKVVFDTLGRAMYFSRFPIPFVRDVTDLPVQADPPLFHQHIGLYAYRREFLLQLSAIPPSPLELAERLEQLRVLETGHSIQVGVIEHAARGIDTAADYAAFLARRRAG